jgi:hypothetical protein
MTIQSVETEIATSLAKVKTVLDEARKTIDSMAAIAEYIPLIGPFAKVLQQVTDALDDLADVAAKNASNIAGIQAAQPSVVLDPSTPTITVP